MSTTLNRAYPYPDGTAQPNVPYWLQALAEAVDLDIYTRDQADLVTVNAITWGAAWRTPTTNPHQGIVLNKVGGRVTMYPGGVENAALATAGGYGQSIAGTMPVGFRPAKTVAIPCMVSISATSMLAGAFIVSSAGVITLQTITAYNNIPVGSLVYLPGQASWVAAS